MPLAVPRTNETNVRINTQETFSQSFAKVNTVGMSTVEVNTPTPRSDEELFQGMAQRDENALSEAFHRYAGSMCGIAYRILRDQHTSEDVVAAAFLQVWRSADELVAATSSLGGCLALTTRELALAALRFGSSGGLRTASPVAISGTSAEVSGTSERTRQILRALSPGMRSAVEMAFFDGLGPEEIAAVTATTSGEVCSGIRASLLLLRKALEP